MQLPLLQPQQHTHIRRLLAILLLQPADILDILELGLGETFVVAGFAAQTAEDETGFGVAADFDEPAGGFGHPPDDGEEGWKWGGKGVRVSGIPDR